MSAVVRLVDRRTSTRHENDPAAAETPGRLLTRLVQEAVRSLEDADIPATGEGAILLHRAELIADEAGEILLRPGGSERAVILVSAEPVIETGRAVPHITAAGENVSGCRYLRFADGLVLYHPPDLRLEIVHLADGDA